MSGEFSISVKAKSKLPRLLRRLPFYADAAARGTAERALEVMQSLTPVGDEAKHDWDKYPQHLRDSEHVERMGPGEYAILIDNDYWVHVNYGTRYMPAQPFVEPAIQVAQREAGSRAVVALNMWQSEGGV